MREYPEEIVLYEGELVQKEREGKNGRGGKKGNRTNSLANRRRQSAESIFKTSKSISEVEAEVNVSLFVLSEVRQSEERRAGGAKRPPYTL